MITDTQMVEAVKIIESEHVWLPRTYGWRKVEDAHEMATVGLTANQRRRIRRLVIKKNMVRGYYDSEAK